MNDFHGLLPSYYGLKPQGKLAPMAPPRSYPIPSNSPFDFDIPSDSSLSDEGDFGNLGDLEYVFGANFRATDSFFNGPTDSSSSPVFDKPLFDVPVFDDLLPGFGASSAPSNGEFQKHLMLRLSCWSAGKEGNLRSLLSICPLARVWMRTCFLV